jgi:hypothetical protein
MAWTYSISFPLSVAGLLALRIIYGYEWPLPPVFGLILIVTGGGLLLRDLLLPMHFTGTARLKRQAMYSDVWVVLVGSWMQWTPLHDIGLVLLIAIASSLWPLSHLEMHKNVRRLRQA